MKTPKYQENPKLEKLRVRSLVYESYLPEIIAFTKLYWFALAKLWKRKIESYDDEKILCHYGLRYENGKYSSDFHWNPRLLEVNKTIFSGKIN